MRVISSIAILATFAPGLAFAEPPAATGPSDTAPVAVVHPPVPAELAPLSQDFQAAMASSQLQTYRYNQLTEQALALKKLCDTGFGPSDVCPKAGPAAAASVEAANEGELPTIAAIDGVGGALTALLVLPDGRRMTVRPGTVLPGGLIVGAITGDDVRVRSLAGGEKRLPFEGGLAR
jgi:type IV pilus biogenesis protein PilP